MDVIRVAAGRSDDLVDEIHSHIDHVASRVEFRKGGGLGARG